MEQKNSKKTMSFTRMDRMVLESYKTLCEGLANYLGDGYEIVLHSLENYDNSVIKIINGYYTGRKEGAPITDLALQAATPVDPQERAPLYAQMMQAMIDNPTHLMPICSLYAIDAFSDNVSSVSMNTLGMQDLRGVALS